MINGPLSVSVIMPVYNGEAFLLEAVKSVLRQECGPLEIIIINDGSTDRTSEIAAGLEERVRYVYQQNRGPSVARNKGLEMARGNVIGFLDSDDLWIDSRLRVQLACLSADPSLDIVMGHVQYLQMRGDQEEGQIHEYEIVGGPFTSFHLGSALFRKSAFDKAGLFDGSLRYSEDVDWFMLARERGISIRMLDDVTLLYRQHSRNMTKGKNPVDLNIVRVLKKSLDRRRLKNNGPAEQLQGIPDIKTADIFTAKSEKGSVNR